MSEYESSESLVETAPGCCRRSFMKAALGCGTYTLFALGFAPASVRRAFAAHHRGEVVAEEAYARIEKLGDGLWSVISTPEGGFVTVSNGGVIAGDDGVLAVEGFMTPRGGGWLRGHAERLAGRPVSHVVLTHFHSDHIGGLSGFMNGDTKPAIVTTAKTREALPATLREREDTVVIPDNTPLEIDLGSRKVRLVPRRGHTPSDVTVEVEWPNIAWCGDLLWNGMFPNYVNATPSTLSETCKDLLAESGTTYVPGHGSIGDRATTRAYLDLLEHVGEAAKAAHAKGTPAAEAWKTYEVPESLGVWGKFRPNIYQAAFEAWESELNGA